MWASMNEATGATHRERESERESERQRQSERATHRERERERERECEREREREREGESERAREGERERESWIIRTQGVFVIFQLFEHVVFFNVQLGILQQEQIASQ